MIETYKIAKAMNDAISKIIKFSNDFTNGFPAPQSDGYVYPNKPEPQGDWTEGFYTGMLILAYERTGDSNLKEIIDLHLASFKRRIDKKYNVDHHDLGFLYSLSSVAAYKVFENETDKETALKAAEHLCTRFKPIGGFIQAWGGLDNPESNRLIIDCMLNIPLLYWATEVTEDAKYRDIAQKHAATCLSVITRTDGTTYHTYYFDLKTGEPLKGVTHQGFCDDSCWSRGQAWGIYGTALQYAYTKDRRAIPEFERITDYFLSHLGSDNIPYWDLCFSDGSGEPRDTSAAAIAVCGMLEMSKHIDNPKYAVAADKILESLIDNYTTENVPRSNGLLTDGMYARTRGDNPECNIWGDYFYMEALTRKLNPDWKMYW